MAEFSKLVITNKGQELLAKMIAGSGNIEFTKISASNTKYTDAQLEGLASLSNVKQTSLISKITRTSEVAIKVEAAFSNRELTEGYYMKALGLYAVDPDAGEILYAVTRETSGNCYMPAYNGITVSGAYVQLVTTVGNAENVSLEVNDAFVATIEDIKDLQKQIADLEAQCAEENETLQEQINQVKNIAGNPVKYSVMQKKQVTLSTLQRVTIRDEYTNSDIAGVSFYLDLDSFSFQNDYLYTEPDNGQPLEDFYDENDSNYSFSMNVTKYYIYVCNKDTGNVLDSMSIDIEPYYYSGGAEEFLSDISNMYYFYDKTKQEYIESDYAPSGVNTYYETSGYVYAYANSLSLLNNILIHDTAADIIFSGSERVDVTTSVSNTSPYSSLSSLVDYMTKPYGRKGIVFLVGKSMESEANGRSFLAIGYYDGKKDTSVYNLVALHGAIANSNSINKATILIRASGVYFCYETPLSNFLKVETIGVIRLP